MTTSGTATFNLDLVDLIDEAYERCGMEGARNGYDLRTARRSLNLLLTSWANMGLNLWTLEQGTVPMVAGTATYTLPADTVDLLDTVLRTTTSGVSADIAMTRISVSTYATIPNKAVTGRPIQVFIERLTVPRITVWPVPDVSSTYTMVYWRLRRIQDAAQQADNTMDVPFRFLPALVSGLASYLAPKTPTGMDRLQYLQGQYMDDLKLAMDEDRDRSSVMFLPAVGYR